MWLHTQKSDSLWCKASHTCVSNVYMWAHRQKQSHHMHSLAYLKRKTGRLMLAWLWISIKHLLLNKHLCKDANYSFGEDLWSKRHWSETSITFSMLMYLINFYEHFAVCSNFLILGWQIGLGSFFTFVYTRGMLAVSTWPDSLSV